MRLTNLTLSATALAVMCSSYALAAAGPPVGVPAGPPAGIPLGPPAGIPSGPPAGIPAGPPAGVPLGPPVGVPAGPPEGVALGPPEGLPSGPPADPGQEFGIATRDAARINRQALANANPEAIEAADENAGLNPPPPEPLPPEE